MRPLQSDERVTLDLASLEEWGDEPDLDPASEETSPSIEERF